MSINFAFAENIAIDALLITNFSCELVPVFRVIVPSTKVIVSASFSLIVIPDVPSIFTWSVELPTVTTPFTICIVSESFSLIVIPDVPSIFTWSVELPIVITAPVTSKTSLPSVNIDMELFSITTFSSPVVPVVPCSVILPPVMVEFAPNDALVVLVPDESVIKSNVEPSNCANAPLFASVPNFIVPPTILKISSPAESMVIELSAITNFSSPVVPAVPCIVMVPPVMVEFAPNDALVVLVPDESVIKSNVEPFICANAELFSSIPNFIVSPVMLNTVF